MLQWSPRILMVAVVCSFAVLPSWADEATDAANIKEWVTGLDDDRYAIREEAQKQLELSGLAATEAIAETSQNGSLESSTRAINILLFWSESPDRTLRVAALEKLAALPNRPKESRIAVTLLADAREEEALEAIVELGGFHTIYFGMQTKLVNGQQMPKQVVIGSKWRGGIVGLKHLTVVRHATILSFHSAPIDDTAIDLLLDLQSVRRFEFYGTRKVSADAIAKLKQRLPNAIVDVRSGARMGIQCYNSGAATIDRVLKDSAADKAGLQKGDLIVELDGEKIQDFSTLTAHIGQHEPGDSVELTIVRNRKALQITVKFDRWGLDEAQLQLLNSKDGDASKMLPPPIRLDRR